MLADVGRFDVGLWHSVLNLNMDSKWLLMMTVFCGGVLTAFNHSMDKQEETNRQAEREESEAAILLSMHNRSPWSLMRIGCSVRTWAPSDTFKELMLQRWLNKLQKGSFVCNWHLPGIKFRLLCQPYEHESHICVSALCVTAVC